MGLPSSPTSCPRAGQSRAASTVSNSYGASPRSEASSGSAWNAGRRSTMPGMRTLPQSLPTGLRWFQLELAPIRVNLIAAGFVDTPLSASILGEDLDKRRDELRATLPIRRVVGPADVAALAVHLMSNTALTGATYDIDGGQQLVS